MFKTMIGALAVAAALPATAAATGPAHKMETASTTVRYDDLNLATPAGVKRLDRRIDAAARSVCKVGGARSVALGERAVSRSCMIAAKAAASKRVALVVAQDARGG